VLTVIVTIMKITGGGGGGGGGIYATLTVIVAIREGNICSVSSYCDNIRVSGSFICSANGYCDNKGRSIFSVNSYC
jgi:hypothetical protein